MPPRIALIHAVTVAMQPIEDAFGRHWPEAERVNILDDSLSPDRARAPELTRALHARITGLARYAREIGADGVLFTCSAFGEAIADAARAAIWPVLKPNEAMFEAALARGRRIGMLATFEPAIASMTAEFSDLLRETGTQATLETICVPDAMTALRAGDAPTHNALLAEAATRLAPCDAVMLAHFSTSRAEAAVGARLDVPVLTSPGSSVTKLKRALAQGDT